MAGIVTHPGWDETAPVGGKAAALARLRQAGFAVPEFFVVLPDTEGERVLEAFDTCFAPEDVVAVRSSAVGEDSADHSFAGQFDSFLNVRRNEVPDRCRDVWASGASERVASYGRERGAAVARPAALVQRMVDARAAGVAFSADPVSGRRRLAVVSAVPGLGEKLVSGECDADTFAVNREGRTERRELADDSACVDDVEVARVAELAVACAKAFGSPQDIEWAIGQNGDLWLLQSRPITSLADKPDLDAPRRIWDNSNIAESYSGVTTPLTFTFARDAYEHVYRTFCSVMRVPPARVAANDEIFGGMIGLVRGRVYYNLVNWYRLLALLPGFRLNRGFMEQMMGVKEPMPEEVVRDIDADASTGRWRDGVDLVKMLWGLLGQMRRLPESIEQFRRRVDSALATGDDACEPHEWAAHWRELQRRLLTNWDAPLVNDFVTMVFCGLLRKLSAKWCGDAQGQLANALLGDIGDIVSAEPARRIRAMAEKQARGEEIEADMAAYLEKFADRCVEELKLESPTLADDPAPLRDSVAALAERIRSGHAKEVARTPPAMPALRWPRSWIFRWVLDRARTGVRNRENLRFERTRVFGRVRRIARALGEHFMAAGKLREKDDVFYLRMDEILGYFDGRGVQRITPELVALRKEEFEQYRRERPPPDRFQTFGAPGAYERFEDLLADRVEAQAAAGEVLRGIGACAGVVRGPVRVVRDPRGTQLAPGEILVAQQTDPGWVVLFPSAAALLVERGSLLSHSAIVAREMGIPAVVSIPGVTAILRDGQEVEMNGETGVVRLLEDV